MDAARTLSQDHALLRQKLAFLESAMQVAPEARFVLREMCFSLQRALQEHMHQEARAFQDPAIGALPMVDHASTQELFRAVNELLLGGMRASMPLVVSQLSHAIAQLGAKMSEQERALFPLLGDIGPQDGSGFAPSISGAMSVNEVVQRYPHTERLFEQLGVHRWREGYESVDELAWRHGLNGTQFLEELRQVASAVSS